MNTIRSGRGFTLVEMLAVIAIIGILVALSFPAVQAARETSRRASCANNLKQLGLAMQSYESVHSVFPPGEIHSGSWNPGYQSDNDGRPHCDWDGQIGCWMNLIFPQIEQQVSYDQLDFQVWPQYASDANREVMRRPFRLFLCPSDPYRSLTTPLGPGGEQNRAHIIHYYAVAGPEEHSTLQYKDADPGSTYGHCNRHRGMFFNDSDVKFAQIEDGSSTTVMLCEVWGRKSASHNIPDESSRGMNAHAVVYFNYPPNSNHDSPWRANSFHPLGVNVAFADGKVQMITNTIDLATWQAISTIRDQEPVDGF